MQLLLTNFSSVYIAHSKHAQQFDVSSPFSVSTPPETAVFGQFGAISLTCVEIGTFANGSLTGSRSLVSGSTRSALPRTT